MSELLQMGQIKGGKDNEKKILHNNNNEIHFLLKTHWQKNHRFPFCLQKSTHRWFWGASMSLIALYIYAHFLYVTYGSTRENFNGDLKIELILKQWWMTKSNRHVRWTNEGKLTLTLHVLPRYPFITFTIPGQVLSQMETRHPKFTWSAWDN